MHSPAEGNRDILWPVQPSQPCTESAETQAVGQEVACDDQGLPGHSKKPPSCKGTDSVPPRQPFLLSKPCLSQGQREPRGTAMLPVTHILAFGAWLVVQSMAATKLQGPKPVLSILPGHEVAAGSGVLLQCTFQYANAGCFLYLEGRTGAVRYFPEREAKFHLSQVVKGDGGRYSCQCYIKETPPKWFSTSEYLELVVRESQLPRPSISVMPWDGAILGTPATILCKCPCQGTAMLLYKAGNISAWKRAQVVRNMATFTIARVDQEDGGTYICRYGNESDPSNLSQPSHSVELLVKDPGLARPSLFLEPRGHVRPGTNATLLCTGVGQSAQVYFWMDRKMIKKTETKGNVATFVLPHVMGHHGGTYACTYHSRKQPYLSSELSNTVWLVVADYTWGNTVRLALGAGILILLGLIVAEAMHSHRPTLGHLGTL
ncbi:T-cell-interacting, activating receptor on myeloid cells protein 1 isoform X2 [Struthio camelus]|uniref:T-cell-interacting, activating receptor on myeloid cells protein 1 isoform X2 n=1 Tax=Struthio camelus TaxID=8801 RepID=UPI0036040974